MLLLKQLRIDIIKPVVLKFEAVNLSQTVSNIHTTYWHKLHNANCFPTKIHKYAHNRNLSVLKLLSCCAFCTHSVSAPHVCGSPSRAHIQFGAAATAIANFTLQCIIRPRRSRSAAAYSHQTFPCTICRSVCLSVCPVHCVKTADRSRQPFGTIRRTGPRMRQVLGFGNRSTGRGTFGANLDCTIVTNGDFTGYVWDSASTVGAAVSGGACGKPRHCCIRRGST